MNMNEEWRQMEATEDKELSALLEIGLVSELSSKSPLKKIKRSLLLNSCWGVLISGFYAVILIYFPFWQVLACLGTVLLFTLWAVIKTIVLYRRISVPFWTNTLLQEMERHYNNICQWMSLQKWIGLVIYPVSAAGGFMLGGYVGSGKPIGQFMSKPDVVLILIALIAILVPICFYLAKWMSHKAFGQYASQLKVNIDRLKEEV